MADLDETEWGVVEAESYSISWCQGVRYYYQGDKCVITSARRMSSQLLLKPSYTNNSLTHNMLCLQQ